jgi:6-phosphogluconolactonase/glucosamine-6-phosphate isomerase/deaminase
LYLQGLIPYGNSEYPDKVPRKSFLMGIATILEATEIVLITSGSSKAPILEAIRKLESHTIGIPASFLLEHSKVLFFVD